MKKIFPWLLAVSLIFGASTVVKAQAPKPPLKVSPQHSSRTPEATIEEFLSDWMSGLYIFQNDYVEGINADNPEPVEIDKMVQQDIGNFLLAAKNIRISPDPQNTDLVTASFTLVFQDNAMGFHIMQNDSVQLKRHLIRAGETGTDNEYWSIIPGDPQKYFYSAGDQVSGLTEKLATLTAYPGQILPQIYLHQSEMQLKQLGLALLMLSQDYDEKVDVNRQNYVEKLTPYLKNVSIFTAPGNDPGIISYDINSAILGLNLSAIKAPSETVAFYLGHNQKLEFRYDGKSVVCFMDGHVEAISPEEAKDLQWKP